MVAHVASLALLFAAVWLLARRFAAHRWTAAACCLAVTLRHRITETGANTFEGYYHPRGLAFACGAGRGRRAVARAARTAWALVGVAMVLHPDDRPLVGGVAGGGDVRDCGRSGADGSSGHGGRRWRRRRGADVHAAGAIDSA